MGKPEKLEAVGNKETMNFNEILYQNVQGSQYLRNLHILTTYEEVLEEIKLRVTNLEPNIPNSPNPYVTVSTAFCLLFKLWTLKLSVRQMEQMVTTTRSPYIRCLGFLYLRYTYPPAKFMEWFEDFLGDEEKVKVRAGDAPPTVEGLAARRTVGQFIRDLLFNKKYFGTMLPPIPVPVMKTIEETVRKFDEEVAQEAEEAAPVERASRPRGGNDDDDDDDGVRPRRRESPPVRRAGSRSPVRSRSPESSRGREREPDRSRDRNYYDRERERGYSDRDRSDRSHSDRDRSYADRDRSDRSYADRDRSDRSYADRDRSDRSYADRDRDRERSYYDRDRRDSRRDRSRSRSPHRSSSHHH